LTPVGPSAVAAGGHVYTHAGPKPFGGDHRGYTDYLTLPLKDRSVAVASAATDRQASDFGATMAFTEEKIAYLRSQPLTRKWFAAIPGLTSTRPLQLPQHRRP
jgi:hypothetical protein